MKAKYLILISLLLLFTISSVSAIDNTISDNVTEDQNIEVITSIQPVILGNSSNSTQTYCISDDNYDDYFNSTTGGFLSNSTIKDGDILKIANVSNKLFTISKSLTITSNSSTNVIFNSSLKLVTGSDNTIVSNLTIRNTDSSLPILLENVSNIIISKNNIFVSGDSNSTIVNGILGEAINNLNIIGNVITVNGKNQTSSIGIIDSGNISFVSNNITTIGPDFPAKFTPSWEAIYNTIGVFIDNSCNVLFDKNIIDTSYNEFENGGSILGTHINKCNNLTILSNIFKTNGTGYVYTLCIEGVYNSSDNGHFIEISDNNVSAYSKTYGNALKLSNFGMANVNNNEFYAYAENFTYPVYIEQYFNTSNGTIVNNTITGIGHTNYGIEIYGSSSNKILNNMIKVSGNYSMGIGIAQSLNNVIEENKIISSGNDSAETLLNFDAIKAENTGIKIISNSNNTLINNNEIITNGNYTINVLGSNNTITNNYLLSNELFGDESVKAPISNIVANNTPRILADFDNNTKILNITIDPVNVTGNVTVIIGNKTYVLNLTDGKTSLNLETLDFGYYNLSITYNGDSSYPPFGTNVTIAFLKEAILSGSNIVMYFKNGTRYYLTLVDKEGNPLANKTVIIHIVGNNMTRITDENGTVSIAINLRPDTYNVSATFDGDDVYGSASVNNTITVLSTISGNDIVKLFKNDTQYYGTFVDGEGNPLVNASVTFNIYGVFYNRITDENGTARLNINLAPGEYIITAKNPFNNETKSNNISVLSSIESQDVKKMFKNDTQYYATFLDKEGKPLANTNVTFNIYGVFYNRTTDENGTARLNINLAPGKYIITAINPVTTEMKSNNITVLPRLFGYDVNMKYNDGSHYRVKLVDEQKNPIINATITMNIYGMFYNRTTGDDGVARLNINLIPGEYILTAYYEDSIRNITITTSNNITVNR